MAKKTRRHRMAENTSISSFQLHWNDETHCREKCICHHAALLSAPQETTLIDTEGIGPIWDHLHLVSQAWEHDDWKLSAVVKAQVPAGAAEERSQDHTNCKECNSKERRNGVSTLSATWKPPKKKNGEAANSLTCHRTLPLFKMQTYLWPSPPPPPTPDLSRTGYVACKRAHDVTVADVNMYMNVVTPPHRNPTP